MEALHEADGEKKKHRGLVTPSGASRGELKGDLALTRISPGRMAKSPFKSGEGMGLTPFPVPRLHLHPELTYLCPVHTHLVSEHNPSDAASAYLWPIMQLHFAARFAYRPSN